MHSLRKSQALPWRVRTSWVTMVTLAVEMLLQGLLSETVGWATPTHRSLIQVTSRGSPSATPTHQSWTGATSWGSESASAVAPERSLALVHRQTLLLLLWEVSGRKPSLPQRPHQPLRPLGVHCQQRPPQQQPNPVH